MTTLADKILAIHAGLSGSAGFPHAFGGALALAWCTQRARGTIDIDLNVFIATSGVPELLAALPSEVAWSKEDQLRMERDGQTRLWWDRTPLDLFVNTTEFHEQAATRVRWHEFAGQSIPFLSCDDLAVFKVFFNRTKDWADLEEMESAGTLDIDRVIGVIVRYLGPDDERIARLIKLTS